MFTRSPGQAWAVCLPLRPGTGAKIPARRAGLKWPHWVVPSVMDGTQLHEPGQQRRVDAVHAGIDAKAIEAAARALAGDRVAPDARRRGPRRAWR